MSNEHRNDGSWRTRAPKPRELEPLKKAPRSLLVDWQIKELALAGMIEDFATHQVKAIGQHKVISYGLSSAGYDMRIADEFRIFSAATGKLTCIDPKAFDEDALVNFSGNVCIIPPNSFALGRSVEYFRIPRNVTALCLGKSTYARVGIICNFTPFEAEWEGHVTIEISNTTPLPCKIYANEGIAQALFWETEQPTVSYADRKGKYQKQVGVTLARV
jgi:dCTP deaminase